MSNILAVEFYRLKKSKLFWILLGVTAALPLLAGLFELAVIELMDDLFEMMASEAWVIADQMNLTTQALSSFGQLLPDFELFALIFTSIFLCREFSFGTFRNALAANRSRMELYVSYLLIALTVGFAYMGAEMLTTVIFYGASFGFVGLSAAQSVAAVALAFAMGTVVMIFAQSLLCMLLFCTRKLAPTLACSLLICLFAPAIAEFIVTFLQIFSAAQSTQAPPDMSWVPLYNASLLDVGNPDGALVGKILLYYLPLEALFGVLGWVAFRKADLK